MARSSQRFPRWVPTLSVLAFGLAACGQAASPAPGASVAPGESAPAPAASATAIVAVECPEGGETVTFWTSHTEPDSETLKQIVEDFNAQGGTCVKMVIVPGAETDIAKLTTAVRGGTGPDVYMLDRFTTAERAAAGVLSDLSAMGADDLAGDYLPFALEEATFQGTIYALPFDTDTRALFYRKDVLAEAGVSQEQIDSLDPANGPITLDELAAIADAADQTDEGGALQRAGFIPWVNQGWHYTWGFAHGGEFADIEACKVTPTHEGVVAGFQFMYDWAERKDPALITTWQSTYTPPENPASQDPFYTGNLAMEITGDWVINQFKQYAPDADYGITWIPVPEAGMDSVTWAGGWSMVIPTGATNAEGGWEFMQYIAGEEGQRAYVQGTSHLPTLQSLVADETIFEEKHQFFRELLEVARNRPVLPIGAFYWDALTTAQDAVTRNSQTPEEALQEAQDQAQPRLDEFCPLT